MRKRIVVISDLHSGSEVGLTTQPKNNVQRQLLARYKYCIQKIGQRPYLLVCNGDANDGQNRKQSAKDLTQPDVADQVKDAAKLIRMWNAQHIRIVEGTAYHTGDTVQYEKVLAHELHEKDHDTTFSSKLRLRVNGWFKADFRHKLSRSTIPHGRATPALRQIMWQIINAALEARRKKHPVTWPHLKVFSHVHYTMFIRSPMGAVLITPCWKSIGDRFGDLECDGEVHLGASWIDVGDKEEDDWTCETIWFPSRLESKTEDL